MDTTVFSRSTGEPCPICLRLVDSGEMRREAVMPLPKFGPMSVTGGPCCFDCQASENIVKFGVLPEFEMARVAVANDRQELLRLPEGVAKFKGLCKDGLILPSSLDDLDNHLAWLDRILPLEEE